MPRATHKANFRASNPPGPKCPICGKPALADNRPFCSPRCRDVDLGRWFGGGYAISRPLSDEDDLSAVELDRRSLGDED